MPSATIRLFLPHGDPKRLRTAEISNWNGKAIAAPRTDLEQLLAREEVTQPGVYLLIGDDTSTGRLSCYIGEAEVIKERLKQHKDREWHSAIVFVSKDENLTKLHIRFLEGQLIAAAESAARAKCVNGQSSGSRLPESDREDMLVFLEKILQLLPVLGTDILIPARQPEAGSNEHVLTTEIKGFSARGRRTPNGFVVFKGSEAVRDHRPAAAKNHPWVVNVRDQFIADGTLEDAKDHYVFARDVEFSSPSAAASVVHGGGTNGQTAWKTEKGMALKDLEA